MQKGVDRPFHGSEKNAHPKLNHLRAQWQTKVWMSSHVTKPNIGSPLEHGWERKCGKLVPVQWRQSSWKVSSAHAQG